MTEVLMTVEQAARALGLHVKTVLRYIRDGKLPATRVGKSYRIARAQLDDFAGVPTAAENALSARATCVVDVLDLTSEEAQRLAGFIQSAALARDPAAPVLHVETAYDPMARGLKCVVVGDPAQAGRLLEMVALQVRTRE